MGGFEGGDEGGFWDEDPILSLIDKQNENRTKHQKSTKPHITIDNAQYSIKAHAKATIFLKITGYLDNRPTLLSRVVRLHDLYDVISFVPCECDTFTLEGCDGIDLHSNTIYKAYQALIDYTNDLDIEAFFHEHKVVVNKNIPLSEGLGGSSSDAAAFIHLVKEVCNLVLSLDELLDIANAIDSELKFFILNFTSANVSGFGEIVEPFEEETLNLKQCVTDIKCDTHLLFQTFKKELSYKISLSSFETWATLDSKSIIKQTANPVIRNDLYAAALLAYPELKKDAKKSYVFSGCTFFELLD